MPSFSWVVLGLIAALGGAGVAVLGKVGLAGIDPTLATTVRSAVMTLVLVGVSLATGKLGPPAGIVLVASDPTPNLPATPPGRVTEG